MKSFATILALAFVAVNAASKGEEARAAAEGNAWGPGGNPEKGGNDEGSNGNAWGPGGNPTKGGNGGDNNGNAYGPDGKRLLEGNAYAYGKDKESKENEGNAWGPGGNPTKGGNGGDNKGNAYGPDGKRVLEGKAYAYGKDKESRGNRWGPGGNPDKGGNGGDNNGNANGPDNGAPDSGAPALGGASLGAQGGQGKRRNGVTMVRASCKDMSDDSMMKLFARAHSLEADGSGNEIKSQRTQAKVDAMEVKISGYAMGPADSTCYAFIENDCSAAAHASYDTANADFSVDTNEGGQGKFRFTTGEYVASDLIDGAMTLNLRDSSGDSMLCCTFMEL